MPKVYVGPSDGPSKIKFKQPSQSTRYFPNHYGRPNVKQMFSKKLNIFTVRVYNTVNKGFYIGVEKKKNSCK